MTKIFESTIEEFVIELLQNQGWQYLSPEEQELERLSASGGTYPWAITLCYLCKWITQAGKL